MSKKASKTTTMPRKSASVEFKAQSPVHEGPKVTNLSGGGASTGQAGGAEIAETKFAFMVDKIMLSYLEHLKLLKLWLQIAEILKFGPKRDLLNKVFHHEKSYDISLMCPYCRSKEEPTKGSLCLNPKCR